MTAPLNFHLEHYDGPLDLLLDLIRKQEINIYDIPIAQITAQYLEYMQRALEMDVELSAEFIYMAATLIHIKSKMLLPRDPELDKLLPEEDPRKELVDRLLEHERFKSAAEMLHQKRVIEEAVWSNPQIEQFLAEDNNPGLAVTLFDLVKTFQVVLERTKSRPIYEIDKEDVSVPDMIRYLRNVFENESRSETISARGLFERQRSRRAMICLFLAVLEMVKLQAIGLVQNDSFGEIGLKRLKGFESAFGSEQTMTVIDEGYH
ncbi:MAG: chromosome segregation protein ScpA [Acidobacteria bacterium]|nr:MAG: chromosome segregation protein ScpA [Acidobacteriota bacterium]